MEIQAMQSLQYMYNNVVHNIIRLFQRITLFRNRTKKFSELIFILIAAKLFFMFIFFYKKKAILVDWWMNKYSDKIQDVLASTAMDSNTIIPKNIYYFNSIQTNTICECLPHNDLQVCTLYQILYKIICAHKHSLCNIMIMANTLSQVCYFA